MKKTIQNIGRLCCLLALTQGLTIAQSMQTPKSAAPRGNTKSAKPDAEQTARLQALRLSTLTRTMDSIKKIDEPALRISARNEMLKYLTADGVLSEDDSALASAV